jgi:hypothetical protein
MGVLPDALLGELGVVELEAGEPRRAADVDRRRAGAGGRGDVDG